ncbi:ABC transporter permease [Bacillus testis]|uniref:ABC transporter permease n=1 Tax=Bacillus testis TaxID=1622072 RepID=UPI00067EAFB1|nr:ABC transporter permease [Bacillus testis]
MNTNETEIITEAVPTVSISNPPTGFRVIMREFKKDKLAMASLIILVVLIVGIFIGAMMINQEEVMKVSLSDRYAGPGEGFFLGADQGGRSIMGQLVIGARNSIAIGFSITILTAIIGIAFGLVTGFYGGMIDNILMRINDFILVLPTLMIIIVFVTIVPKYNLYSFIFIMSAFYWVGTARLIRSKALSESRRDYVSASKTMGTSDFVIIFKQIMPNISSLIIVELTLNFAGNIGIETGLSYLGFGLPPNVPSLGTLISYSTNPEVLSGMWWIWLPASLLILVLMLGINYVGQALRRAADSRQRLG